jgi:hypothetical protein
MEHQQERHHINRVRNQGIHQGAGRRIQALDFGPINNLLEQEQKKLGKPQNQQGKYQPLQQGLPHQGGHPSVKKIHLVIHAHNLEK